MAKIQDILSQMRDNPKSIRFSKGMSKAYQVKQVLQAVERLEVQSGKKY